MLLLVLQLATAFASPDSQRVLGPAQGQPGSSFGACAAAYRLDFFGLRTEGNLTYIFAALVTEAAGAAR